MAKKAKKKSVAKKAKKVKRSKAKAKTSVKKKTKAKAAKPSVKKKAAKKSKPKKKPAPKTFAEKVTSAVQAVIGTAHDTNELRNKMEPPGVSETQ